MSQFVAKFFEVPGVDDIVRVRVEVPKSVIQQARDISDEDGRAMVVGLDAYFGWRCCDAEDTSVGDLIRLPAPRAPPSREAPFLTSAKRARTGPGGFGGFGGSLHPAA